MISEAVYLETLKNQVFGIRQPVQHDRIHIAGRVDRADHSAFAANAQDHVLLGRKRAQARGRSSAISRSTTGNSFLPATCPRSAVEAAHELIVIGIFTALISVPLGSVLAWLMVRSDLPGKAGSPWASSSVHDPVLVQSDGLAVGIPQFARRLAGFLPPWVEYSRLARLRSGRDCTRHGAALTRFPTSWSPAPCAQSTVSLRKWAKFRRVQNPDTQKHYAAARYARRALRNHHDAFESRRCFGVAANLGLRIGYFTLATKMRDCIDTRQAGLGYAMALLLIVLASGTIFANQRMIGTRKSYETMGGKGTKHALMSLGKAKLPLMRFLGLFLFIAMFVPCSYSSWKHSSAYRSGYGLDNLTLYNWIGEPTLRTFHPLSAIPNAEFIKGLWKPIELTVISSIITAFCGQFLGYISSRGRGKWYGKLTEQLVFVPYLMPSIAFAAIYLAMWSTPHGIIPSLYGTFTLLVLASVVKHFPFASRAGTANMMQIGVELEEAADIAGASFWRRMARIIIPLAKQGFISGFMLVFISIARVGPDHTADDAENRTLSYIAFTYSRDGLPQCRTLSRYVCFCSCSYPIGSPIVRQGDNGRAGVTRTCKWTIERQK